MSFFESFAISIFNLVHMIWNVVRSPYELLTICWLSSYGVSILCAVLVENPEMDETRMYYFLGIFHSWFWWSFEGILNWYFFFHKRIPWCERKQWHIWSLSRVCATKICRGIQGMFSLRCCTLYHCSKSYACKGRLWFWLF